MDGDTLTGRDRQTSLASCLTSSTVTEREVVFFFFSVPSADCGREYQIYLLWHGCSPNSLNTDRNFDSLGSTRYCKM